MRKISLKLEILLSLVLFSNLAFSQVEEVEALDSIKVKHINLGVKLGIPNLIGGSAEIVLPILGNRIAPYFDYSGFSIDTDEIGTSYSYLEYGANLYFNQKGNGFFLSIGQGKFNTEIAFNALDFGNLLVLSEPITTDFNFNTTNIKLGIKSGGTFYFRFELGFGLADIPDSVDFIATYGGITKSFSEELPPIPGISTSGVLIGNIGFGFSF
jgi:hypothetical protein